MKSLKKRYTILFLLLLVLVGCTPQNKKQNHSELIPTETPNASICKQVVCKNSMTLVRVTDQQLLVHDGTASGLYTLSCKDVQILDQQGQEIDQSELKNGMTLEISYQDEILETYPATIPSVISIQVVKKGNDKIGLYYDLISNIISEDSGLNSDIGIIALDLTQASNLNDAEQSALTYLIGNDYEKECFLSTYETLIEDGLIDKTNLYFPDGILISVAVTKETKKSFSFDLSKWRSGLGAIGYMNSTAHLKKGIWSYKLNGFWIS